MNRLAVLERDRWTCLMPVCLHPCTRAINRSLAGSRSHWAPTVDHIRQRALGGSGQGWNLRAAHRLCNERAARHLPRRHRLRHPVRRGPWGGILEPADALGGQFPDWLKREVKPDAVRQQLR